MPKLVRVVEEYLEDYNSVSNAPMKLVMFLDAIEHVSRITRVIRLPLGNALLLGVGGSGRQSLTRLAAYLEEYEVVQVSGSIDPGMLLLLGLGGQWPAEHCENVQGLVMMGTPPRPLRSPCPSRLLLPSLTPTSPAQIEIAKGYGNNEYPLVDTPPSVTFLPVPPD